MSLVPVGHTFTASPGKEHEGAARFPLGLVGTLRDPRPRPHGGGGVNQQPAAAAGPGAGASTITGLVMKLEKERTAIFLLIN